MWDFLLTKNGVMVAAAVGAAVGAVISHFATRSMVRKEFDEELRQVREHYQSKVVNNVDFQDETVNLVVDMDRQIYESMVKDNLYGFRLDEYRAILNPEDIPKKSKYSSPQVLNGSSTRSSRSSARLSSF